MELVGLLAESLGVRVDTWTGRSGNGSETNQERKQAGTSEGVLLRARFLEQVLSLEPSPPSLLARL